MGLTHRLDGDLSSTYQRNDKLRIKYVLLLQMMTKI